MLGLDQVVQLLKESEVRVLVIAKVHAQSGSDLFESTFACEDSLLSLPLSSLFFFELFIGLLVMRGSIHLWEGVGFGSTLVNWLRRRNERVHVHRDVLWQGSATIHLDLHLLKLLVLLVAHLGGIWRSHTYLSTGLSKVVAQLTFDSTRHRGRCYLTTVHRVAGVSYARVCCRSTAFLLFHF